VDGIGAGVGAVEAGLPLDDDVPEELELDFEFELWITPATASTPTTRPTDTAPPKKETRLRMSPHFSGEQSTLAEAILRLR
jgi:hypothetical protein